MMRIGILGAKGYTAGELLRLLASHPQAEVTCLMARVDAPEPVAAYFPALRGLYDLAIEPIDLERLIEQCDAAFLALPHTAAQEYAARLIEAGLKVVDLSADFRFESVDLYEKTYKVEHKARELNSRIPYGLPELFRDELKQAPAIANPGCHTITAILALAPLMRQGELVDLDRIVISSLTGVSGAGRKPSDITHFPECNESVNAYGVATHRHRPEIEEQLSRLAGRKLRLVFTPHLIPMSRGILSTCTAPLRAPWTTAEAMALYREFYAGEPFIRMLPDGEAPRTGAVMLSNFCDISVVVDEHARSVIAMAATDNLVKGASGQAIQNMNLLFGLDETLGLIPAPRRPVAAPAAG
ncbi:MAG TPA: N-acetyl-gamma-glutamyl-phosphate reductase [Candidatus Sumerlaeota bacterium]|nr:N-acetyl-gamma-glutamyl-phosphate reductase [Candidatus Sumerlaeota bacterium]HPK02850.1 N-acetyl-gamma-glutamyl-phosphate reductase [Candidatus Sumerlaeota bacterium]